MNGETWALLSAYAGFLSSLGQRREAQHLTLVLHLLEPSGRDLSEAMSALEGRGLIDGYRLTLQGLTVVEGMRGRPPCEVGNDHLPDSRRMASSRGADHVAGDDKTIVEQYRQRSEQTA